MSLILLCILQFISQLGRIKFVFSSLDLTISKKKGMDEVLYVVRMRKWSECSSDVEMMWLAFIHDSYALKTKPNFEENLN